jgi:hypothetical protein
LGFDRPVFIVSPPRAGSSLLFRTLMQAPDLYTIGGESHALIEGLPPLHPRARNWSSNLLTAEDATPAIAEALAARFTSALRDREGRRPNGAVRMAEKTPKNSLRIDFLSEIFTDSIFVYLHRGVRETLSSMIEAWESGRFRTYPALPGWPGGSWSLLLVPGWRDLIGRPLAEIVGRQWATTTGILLDSLERLPPERIRVLTYESLLASPAATIASLCASLGLGWDRDLDPRLPHSPSVVSAPEPGKWRRHEAELERIWPLVAEQEERARAFLARAPR